MTIFNVFTSLQPMVYVRTHARDSPPTTLPPAREHAYKFFRARPRSSVSRPTPFCPEAEVRGRSQILKNTFCFRYIAR